MTTTPKPVRIVLRGDRAKADRERAKALAERVRAGRPPSQILCDHVDLLAALGVEGLAPGELVVEMPDGRLIPFDGVRVPAEVLAYFAPTVEAESP